MKKSPAKIDILLEPLLLEASGEQADEFLLQLITVHAEPQFDLEAFERATGRTLTASEREKFVEVQTQANRLTYLGSGMTHPNFRATLQTLSPEAAKRVEQIVPMFC